MHANQLAGKTGMGVLLLLVWAAGEWQDWGSHDTRAGLLAAALATLGVGVTHKAVRAVARRKGRHPESTTPD